MIENVGNIYTPFQINKRYSPLSNLLAAYKMKLVLDIGNTSTKIGVFDKSKLEKFTAADGLISQKELEGILNNYQIESVIISSVRNDSAKLEKSIEKKYKTINLASNKPLQLPYKNLYKTPTTLGRDRMANAAAAINLFPKKNKLIIDAGTCLKFDFVNAKGNYCGGSIAPGLRMRYAALHKYTGKLPLIEPKKSTKLIGQSTEESIQVGVQQGMINEVVETINRYKKNFRSINIILTGGDWRLFAEHLKKPIFADPFLTLKGLHCILENNT